VTFPAAKGSTTRRRDDGDEEEEEEVTTTDLSATPAPPPFYDPLEVPAQDWADLFTSPWLPPTMNVIPPPVSEYDIFESFGIDPEVDEEPREDAGLDALSTEPTAPLMFRRSGGWGELKFGQDSVAAASPLFAHASTSAYPCLKLSSTSSYLRVHPLTLE
jgi:hypothetical protein